MTFSGIVRIQSIMETGQTGPKVNGGVKERHSSRMLKMCVMLSVRYKMNMYTFCLIFYKLLSYHDFYRIKTYIYMYRMAQYKQQRYIYITLM
jgi:hypothetical protein